MVTGTKTAPRCLRRDHLSDAGVESAHPARVRGPARERARSESWSHEEYLAACLQREVAARDAHGGEDRIRAARFPARKSIEEFDFDHARGLKRDLIAHLATLDFVAGSPAHGLLDITVSLLRDTNLGRVNARTRIGHRHQPIPVGTVQRKRSLTFESGVSTRSFCAVSSAMSCARTPTRHSSTSWCSARSTIGCSCPASC